MILMSCHHQHKESCITSTKVVWKMPDADYSSKESHTYNSHSQNRKTRDTISPDTASIYTHR